ncbi:cytochrome c oxidase accessory protein FixG [Acidovorax sp. 56]|uniref:cytochrome c oxidase accessory protein CcoG n=1 Tax=Acidovorax sp. 56 TaxID=2035205 RepID=UPI000C170660|nr:cytochrome c oxidase accessory protein CcoG [Acidovorax sp. 56]PIF28325.1 cytochrome c oxidase accessory protein FixG [Acidovorax sp. 56]
MSSAAAPRAQPIHFYPPNSTLQFGIRAIAGRFNRARWWSIGITQMLFFGLCWAQWQGRPLVSFDLVRQQVHLFGGLFGPQDLLLLTLLLIGGALALFVTSAVGGRIFCGFVCPQSVYTALFIWIEQRVQGTPGQRQRRQASGAPAVIAALWARRLLTWALWAMVSLALGWTLTAYFSSAPALWQRTWQGQLGGAESTLMLGYAAFALAQAGFLREKVCQHMCPYARFQGVMATPQTQSVVYDVPRGEPRRSTAHTVANAAAHTAAMRASVPAASTVQPSRRGDCLDCNLCVEVCPAGIDIRNGLQYECISCGLCIDACDRVMEKARQPQGLIRFASQQGADWRHTLRQRRVRVYFALLGLTALAVVATVAWRVPLQVEVVRDRGVMARQLRNGDVENIYRVHIQNYDTQAHAYRIALAGETPLRMPPQEPVVIASGEERTVAVAVVQPYRSTSGADPGRGVSTITPMALQVQSLVDAQQQRTRSSSFIQPR